MKGAVKENVFLFRMFSRFFSNRFNHIEGDLNELAAAGDQHFEDYVVFRPSLPRHEFYDLLRSSTVYLDTIGLSGSNTAIQAIECGLPVSTREGQFLRGRFGSGLLKRMDMADLVTGSEEAYVDLVVKAVSDAEFRAELRQRIERSRPILFDDVAPIRDLENFLERM